MRSFLFATIIMAAGAPASAATLLGNAQCKAGSDPASPVVAQLWGGETVRVIGRTTGFVRINRGDNGCWVSVGLVGENGALEPPLVDRGAVREQCQCRQGKVCATPAGRRYCIARNGEWRWRRR